MQKYMCKFHERTLSYCANCIYTFIDDNNVSHQDVIFIYVVVSDTLYVAYFN